MSLMAHFQCSEEEAIGRLQALWNPPGKQPPPAPPLSPPPVPDLLPEDEQQLPPCKKTTFADFEEDSTIPKSLPFFPAQYAMDKIKNLEYVDLWYFTTEGILDASKVTHTVADDTFGLLHTDLGLMFQQVKATRASCNVLKDEQLSWDQIATARHKIINTASCWPEKYRMALAKFFMNLEAFKANGTNPRSLILYQAAVRRHWHTALKGSGKPFNLANINEGLLLKLENQIRDQEHEEMQKQASPFPSCSPACVPF